MINSMDQLNFTFLDQNFLWTDINFTYDLEDIPGEYDVLKLPSHAAILIVFYVLVIAVGSIGNTLVVVTMLKDRKLWNPTTMFITCLALADVCVCIVDLPVSIHYQITDNWAFGRIMCHIVPVVLATAVYISSLSMTVIAIDRYILIVFPLKSRMSLQVTVCIVAAITCLSVGFASPLVVFCRYIEITDPFLRLDRRYCIENWPTPAYRRWYTILTLLMQFVIPLSVIGVLYTLIFRRIRTRMNSSKCSRRTRTTKMVLTVVLVFAIAWTPFHMFSLISELNYDLIKGKYYKFVDALLRVFAMSSSCVNPFLYGWFNENFRNSFLNMVCSTANRRHISRGFSAELTTHKKTAGQSKTWETSVHLHMKPRQGNELKTSEI